MKKLLYLFFLLPVGLGAQSNLFIDTSYTAEQMIMDFFDNSCVTPSNITFNGAPAMIGYFEGANTGMGVDAGIVISSGDVLHTAQSADIFSSSAFMVAGDPTLEDLVMGMSSFDAAVLEFDITVSEDGDLDFEYVFGSEEYPEFVGSAFNDVFGFFIDESGSGAMNNIALVPNSTTAVAINNVNADTNSMYFIDNLTAGEPDIVFDGMTTPLPATFSATSATTYHVKIGVTDIADGVFDSGVFISTTSLCGPEFVNPPSEFGSNTDGLTVFLTNESRYGTSWLWDFGDGNTSTERHPDSHTYAEPGTYTITLTTENYCCSNSSQIEVQVGTVSTSVLETEKIAIFPNPTEDVLNVQLTSAIPVQYQLRDLTGRAVVNGQAQGSFEILTQSLDPGIYLLQLDTNEGRITEKIVVR
jgi:PKD repeat protein